MNASLITRVRPGIAGTRGLLYVVFFISGVGQAAIVPLLPRLSAAYELSGAQSALLLALPGLAMMTVSVPAGLAADRFGPRRVSLAAGVLLGISCVLQAVPELSALLLGRLAFGIAYGVVWTTAVTWMSELETAAGSSRLGASVTYSSVGIMAGPAIGGVLADIAGVALPFVLIAGVTFAVIAALAVSRRMSPRRAARAQARTADDAASAPAPAVALGARGMLGVARRPAVLAAAGALSVSGAISGVSQLLISDGLHHAGLSAGRIGMSFSAAAVAYILVSAAVLRLGVRVRTLRFNALATVALALGLVPALASGGAAALILALVLTAAPRAAVSTIAFSLATEPGAAGQPGTAAEPQLGEAVNDGTVFGLLNGAWAAAMVLMPLLAGAVQQRGGAEAGYLAVIIPAIAMAVWLLLRAETGERASRAAA